MAKHLPRIEEEMSALAYHKKNDEKLLHFFILANLISWILWTPAILAARGLLPFSLPQFSSLAGNFGPALAAVIVSLRTGGRKEIVDLLRPLLRWRVSWKLYALALAPLAINLILVGLYALLSNDRPYFETADLLKLIPLLAFWTIFGGPLGEEIGWRGFALPMLQKKYGWLPASLILGFCWLGWHLIRYLDPAQRSGGVAGIFLFAIQVMIFSVLFTWIFLRSANNLFIAVLFHGAINSLQTIAVSLYPHHTPADFGIWFNLLNAALIFIYLMGSIVAAISMKDMG